MSKKKNREKDRPEKAPKPKKVLKPEKTPKPEKSLKPEKAAKAESSSGKKHGRKKEADSLLPPRYQRTVHLLTRSMSEQLEHGRLVSNLAYEIGREMQLPEEECRQLIIAGFFHDIGKTELANETAVQEQQMVVEEMNSVRLHPEKGYDILKRHGFSEEICRSVLYHHENWDGSGYPFNLEGSNIPLGACILRVCDVFCALVSSRPYREAFPPETAMEMMIEEIRCYHVGAFLALQRVLHRGANGEISLPEVSDEVKGVWKTL